MNRLIISVLILLLPNFSEATAAVKPNLKLAPFEDRRYLKSINTKDPLFEATTESGEVSYLRPPERPAVTIYGHQPETVEGTKE